MDATQAVTDKSHVQLSDIIHNSHSLGKIV
jgi:hypothetical protein